MVTSLLISTVVGMVLSKGKAAVGAFNGALAATATLIDALILPLFNYAGIDKYPILFWGARQIIPISLLLTATGAAGTALGTLNMMVAAVYGILHGIYMHKHPAAHKADKDYAIPFLLI